MKTKQAKRRKVTLAQMKKWMKKKTIMNFEIYYAETSHTPAYTMIYMVRTITVKRNKLYMCERFSFDFNVVL